MNLCGSRTLLDAMDTHGCRTLVFSSTSTVYGEPETFPLTGHPLLRFTPTPRPNWRLNNYYDTKQQWSLAVASLRYFNPWRSC